MKLSLLSIPMCRKTLSFEKTGSSMRFQTEKQFWSGDI